MATARIVLKDHAGIIKEEIPEALVSMVINSLPDSPIGQAPNEINVRETLIRWTQTTEPLKVDKERINAIEDSLMEYFHTNSNLLGLLDRLPSQSSETIVDLSSTAPHTISSLLVFALALRRFKLIMSFSLPFYIESKDI